MMRTFGRTLSGLLLLGLLSSWQVGCSTLMGPTIEFTLTDRTNSPRYRSHALVYIDRMPFDDYISIGILVVKAAGDYPLSKVIEALEEEAGRHGCDVVVAREIHRVSSTIPAGGPLLASLELRGLATRLAGDRNLSKRARFDGYQPPPYVPPSHTEPIIMPVYSKPSAPDREFICGVIR